MEPNIYNKNFHSTMVKSFIVDRKAEGLIPVGLVLILLFALFSTLVYRSNV